MSEVGSDQRIENILRLHLTPGVGTKTYIKLIETFGSPEEVFDARVNHLIHQAGVSESVADAIASYDNRDDVKAELELAEKTNVSLVPFDDPAYPAMLKHIYDPPLLLYVRGTLRQDEQALGIVGARKPTFYGEEQARKLSTDLARSGWTIVGGLARGIDSFAHEGALAAGGRTVAVLGHGMLQIYPRENRHLAEQIAERGAVVSEFPMRAKPDPWNFPRRNRIISGMSRGVLIIEATCNSGSLITATWAAEQGRTIFAVPGRVDSALSSGCHALIRDGAVLVERAEDVLQEFGSSLVRLPGMEEQSIMPPNLPEQEATIYAILSKEPKHIDAVITETGMTAAQVSSGLVMLEIKKLITQLPGKNFARA